MSGNNPASIGGKDENKLRPVSIRQLYDGIIVHDNIYDSTGDKLLLSGDGSALTIDQIERMQRINSFSDTIYVTARTHKAMISKRPNVDIPSRVETENITGYTTVKDETLEVFRHIANSKTVGRDDFNSIAVKVSYIIELTSPGVVISLINAITPVEEYLQRHCVNVAMLNALIGQWLGASKADIDKLILVGLIHDCGVTRLPPSIVYAKRELTQIEIEVDKMHPQYTEELLADFPKDIRRAASDHHERLDGSGFPRRLKDNDISLGARITAVSDIYDSMVSARGYKAPRSPLHALALLKSMMHFELDKNVVSILADHLPQELIDKPVTMSDGKIGILREFYPEDIEYPTVEVNKRTFRTNANLYCVSMYSDD